MDTHAATRTDTQQRHTQTHTQTHAYTHLKPSNVVFHGFHLVNGRSGVSPPTPFFWVCDLHAQCPLLLSVASDIQCLPGTSPLLHECVCTPTGPTALLDKLEGGILTGWSKKACSKQKIN